VAAELVADLERVYRRATEADKELTELVAATGTTLLDPHGIGPSGAARLLVEVADITRFPNRAHFCVLERHRPRLTPPPATRSATDSRGPGNRRINRVLHIAATVQLRTATEGRAYVDRKKASGKTPMEAMRCLRRRPSDIVYRRMLDDAIAHTATGPGGQPGHDSDSSATGSHPHTGSSDKPLPGPATNPPKTPLRKAG
jgi:transposase